MPELPEVESVRRSLLPHVLGQTVVAARLFRRDILVAPGDPVGGFSRQRPKAGSSAPRRRPRPISPEDLLIGATIADVLRRGKQLAIIAGTAHDPSSTGSRALVVQLGMSGRLELLGAGSGTPPRHLHARWTLSSGASLVFVDPRRFGALRVFRSADDLAAHWAGLGPDALSVDVGALVQALRGSTRAIKAALLDQSVLAGVGNIYADESLHIARIHPARRAGRLTPPELDRLAAAIRLVLAQAVTAGGSTLRDYADANGQAGAFQSQHAVYGRSGLPCATCGTRLAFAAVAQRTTVWCPSCQPLRTRKT